MDELTKRFAAGLAVGLIGGVGAAVIAHVTGVSIRPWLACVVTVSAALLLVALYESWQVVFGAEPPVADRREPTILTDRKRGGLDVTVRLIERASSDAYRFEILRDRLVRLTEERLRTTHGVDLRAEPDRARALVGDGLAGLAGAAPVRPPGRAELEDWLSRLESL